MPIRSQAVGTHACLSVHRLALSAHRSTDWLGGCRLALPQPAGHSACVALKQGGHREGGLIPLHVPSVRAHAPSFGPLPLAVMFDSVTPVMTLSSSPVKEKASLTCGVSMALLLIVTLWI